MKTSMFIPPNILGFIKLVKEDNKDIEQKSICVCDIS